MWQLFFSYLLFFLPLVILAKEKICLNMIVKNESEVIKRCLDSVKPLIDYWVIVDTGSTDGTQKIIKEYMKGIPGQLYERPWKDFATNRTEAFKLAQKHGDYILLMDADDTLAFPQGFRFSSLNQDLYNFWRGPEGFSYIRPQLIKASLPWKWIGVTHEYLSCDLPYTSDVLDNIRYVSGDGGASSKDAKKFLKNVKLLKKEVKKEPDNCRYAFYLAESYRDSGKKGQALEWYQKRIQMGGWEEEVFWSMLQSSHLLRDLGFSSRLVAESYASAFTFRPHRAEPIYYLAELYNNQGNYTEAYQWLKARETVQKTTKKDILFNMDWIEEFGLLFQLSICSYFVGNYQESLNACDKLLSMKNLPEGWRKLTESNRAFPLAKLQSSKK